MQPRISITIDENLKNRLERYSQELAQGEEKNNISKIVSNAIDRYVPEIIFQ